VALLDASIKVLFAESFELFLTLYGHKLPVLSVSAASDNAMLVSGAADKTIRLWGLDFGDCHRTLHGHTEAIMAVSFVRETHYFFSASKDHTIRYWDADRFEHILTLRGHHAEVWSVVPSRSGALVASISRDRSLRLWTRSDEQVFVEEEREAELEQIFEAGIEKQQQAHEAADEEAAALGLADGTSEAATAARRSLESVKGAERVLEALKTLAEEGERQAEHAKAMVAWTAAKSTADISDTNGNGGGGSRPPVLVPNMLLLGMDEGGYLLKALSSVRAAELEQALLLLPFSSARDLLTRLLPLLPHAPHAELMVRCVLFLVKVHHKQIMATRAFLPALHQLQAILTKRLAAEHSLVGYNLAAMRCMARTLEQSEQAKLFEGAITEQRTARAEAAPVGELRRRTAARAHGAKGHAKKAPKKRERGAEQK